MLSICTLSQLASQPASQSVSPLGFACVVCVVHGYTLYCMMHRMWRYARACVCIACVRACGIAVCAVLYVDGSTQPNEQFSSFKFVVDASCALCYTRLHAKYLVWKNPFDREAFVVLSAGAGTVCFVYAAINIKFCCFFFFLSSRFLVQSVSFHFPAQTDSGKKFIHNKHPRATDDQKRVNVSIFICCNIMLVEMSVQMSKHWKQQHYPNDLKRRAMQLLYFFAFFFFCSVRCVVVVHQFSSASASAWVNRRNYKLFI